LRTAADNVTGDDRTQGATPAEPEQLEQVHRDAFERLGSLRDYFGRN